MISLRTSRPIMSLIGYILKSISTNMPIEWNINELKLDEDAPLARALEGQKKIGWTAMCQGFFHKAWAETQHDQYKKLGVNTRYLNIGRWKRMMSNIMGEYCLDCWGRRNEIIHGTMIPDSRIKQLDRLRKQVKALYGKKRLLRARKNKAIFELPLKKRLKMGLQSTKIWVGMAEEVIRMDRENAIKNTIDHWLHDRQGPLSTH